MRYIVLSHSKADGAHPANTQRHNNVVTMSLQRRDVAATL